MHGRAPGMNAGARVIEPELPPAEHASMRVRVERHVFSFARVSFLLNEVFHDRNAAAFFFA